VNTDADRDRFAAYCVDLTPSDGFVPEEGEEIDCSTPELVPGEPARIPACGTASETSTTLSTNTNLLNDHLYAVAVAAQDQLGNSGPLTDVKCASPRELDDYFELYKRSGGAAGGGFCSLRPGVPVAARGAPLLLGILLLGLRARRARSRA
jgi:hypothetical protein